MMISYLNQNRDDMANTDQRRTVKYILSHQYNRVEGHSLKLGIAYSKVLSDRESLDSVEMAAIEREGRIRFILEVFKQPNIDLESDAYSIEYDSPLYKAAQKQNNVSRAARMKLYNSLTLHFPTPH